jgi:uncharacterized protein (TIGR02996 family)
MTTTDLTALRKAIKDPANRHERATLRMTLADALDEVGEVRGTCPECGGTGRVRENRQRPGGTWRMGWHECPHCSGAGTITDRSHVIEAALQRVLGEPHEDRWRLAYADSIEPTDKGRAEFVRVQVELATPPVHINAATKSLWYRSWDLWQANYKAWEGVEGAANQIIKDSLRRGFIRDMWPTADWWVANGDAICEQHPVTRVRLTTWPGPSWVAEHAGDPDPRFDTIHQQALQNRWPGIAFELPG